MIKDSEIDRYRKNRRGKGTEGEESDEGTHGSAGAEEDEVLVGEIELTGVLDAPRDTLSIMLAIHGRAGMVTDGK